MLDYTRHEFFKEELSVAEDEEKYWAYIDIDTAKVN